MTAINLKTAQSLKKIVTYIDCYYWLSSKTAQWLKKGALLELFGRIGLNVYIGNDSQAHGSLTFHTSHIKILAKSEQETPQISTGAKTNADKETDEPAFLISR